MEGGGLLFQPASRRGYYWRGAYWRFYGIFISLNSSNLHDFFIQVPVFGKEIDSLKAAYLSYQAPFPKGNAEESLKSVAEQQNNDVCAFPIVFIFLSVRSYARLFSLSVRPSVCLCLCL